MKLEVQVPSLSRPGVTLAFYSCECGRAEIKTTKVGTLQQPNVPQEKAAS